MEIQPIVVGTAGHIDHGKSSLVRALTGIDPDRLKEERERGLTIDLGFANFELADGRRVGLVDVPGHERFIRNMVAGASGLDLVVLVVAADDGVMPQTVEHLGIMQLLGLQRGIVALTKIDMVDAELVELTKADLAELLAGTFLEQAPVFPLSSITGEGLDAFRAALDELCSSVEPRSADGVFRMPIQRVFSKPGFGTVCTGIPVSGTARPGDTLELLPGGVSARVRGVHAYGDAADSARAGHSSALNLSDLERARAQRGSVLATPGLFRAVSMVAARLDALPDLPKPITDRTPVRLHTGTADPPGELVLLDVERLEPGGRALVQLRLEEPVVVAPGDRFVLRLLSPEVTLGGGVILEESRHRLKRFKKFVIEELGQAESSLDSAASLLAAVVERRHLEPAAPEELAVEIKHTVPETQALLDAAVADGALVAAVRGQRYLGPAALEQGLERIAETVAEWFAANPKRVQVDKLELERASGLSSAGFGFCLDAAVERGDLERVGGGELRPTGATVELDDETRAVHEALHAGGMKPPTPAELGARFGGEPAARAALAKLCDLDLAVRASHEFFFSREVFDAGIADVAENCGRNGQLVIPELREKFGTSRKYLIPFLEHLDATGVTMRQGSFRVLRKR